MNLKATKNTNVPTKAIVLLEFSLENLHGQKFEVAFLVNNQDIRNPVVG